MSKEDITAAFVSHFYQTLDSNPGSLFGLYVSNYTIPCAMMSSKCIVATSEYFNL
jgi:hypothetical protein